MLSSLSATGFPFEFGKRRINGFTGYEIGSPSRYGLALG